SASASHAPARPSRYVLCVPAPTQLTEETLARGVAELCRRDGHLAAVVERFGPPPLWAREPGFGTLVQIILEQQVSLASARPAYGRLEGLIGPATATRVLELEDAALRSAGFSRQKAGYVRSLGRAVVEGEFDSAGLASLHDHALRLEVIKRKGIRAWSADI